jgi:hypothetical protein
LPISYFGFHVSAICLRSSGFWLVKPFPLNLNAGTWKSAENPEFLPELRTRLPKRPGRSGFGDEPGF